MSFNRQLAKLFEEIAQMLELTGANRFRVNAHAKAARVIADHPASLETLAHDAPTLTAIEGIGKGTAEKIAEFADTGRIDEHEELKRQVPADLLEVMQIPGLGPKTVALMWRELGVESIADLKRIIQDESILNLPRMGAKTVENIEASIAFHESSGARLHLGVATPVAEAVVERLRACRGVREVAFAGSLRRGRETIGDIDVLAAAADANEAMDAFVAMDGVLEVLLKGETKTSCRVDLGAFGVDNRWGPRDDEARGVQIDLRVVDPEAWGAALLYFTGSKEHNVRLRERAIKRGLTLNEYGLFPSDDEAGPPQKRGVRPKAAKTEEAIYAALDLDWIPPTLREDRGEFDAEATPALVRVEDIRCELHSHTTASDGMMSISESAGIAKARGMHTLAITDHSRSSAIANGLDDDRLRAHVEAIRAADEQTPGISILAGSEVDILADGGLDYDDELLAELDVVVASPHAALQQEPGKATERLLRAIEHPLVHVIGHPTGRLIERRPGLEPRMDELIAAAVEHDVALEINAHWMRLDLRDAHVRAAVEAGCKIAINCDVHEAADYDNIRYGVMTAQRGWLPPELCVNAWTKPKLDKWLKGKG